MPAPYVAPQRDPSPYELAHEQLGTGGRELEEIVELLRTTVGVVLATVTVLEGGRFHFLVCSGSRPFATDHDDAICRWSMEQEGVVVVRDLSADERTAAMPFVDGRRGRLRFYASAPVHAPEGTVVGRLCLFDDEPRDLAPGHEHLLHVLADAVSAQLDLRIRRRATVVTADVAEVEHATASRIEHDLRSPLGSMRTSLDLLGEVTHAADDPTTQRLLDVAQRSAVRLTGLVEGLAELHDVSTPPLPRVVHLGDLVQQVFDELHDRLAAVGGWAEASGLPILTCDPDRTTLVLRALVTNAVLFHRDDVPPRVRVTAERVRGIDWRISVVDNGIGIEPEDRERVFEVLTRLTGRPGHGLGLPTALRAVTGQGGRMGIADGPGGVGTRVWFELPG